MDVYMVCMTNSSTSISPMLPPWVKLFHVYLDLVTLRCLEIVAIQIVSQMVNLAKTFGFPLFTWQTTSWKFKGHIPFKETWHWGSRPLKFSCHVMTDGTWIVLGPFWCCICQPLFHGRRNLPHATVLEEFSLGAKNNTCKYTLCFFFARWHGMFRNYFFFSRCFCKIYNMV